MDCTADLLLVFVLDKTNTGTARSKTENIHSISFTMLLVTVRESNTKTKSIFFVAPCCPRGSLVPYKNEEYLHPVLALLGTGAPILQTSTRVAERIFPDLGKCDSSCCNIFPTLVKPFPLVKQALTNEKIIMPGLCQLCGSFGSIVH